MEEREKTCAWEITCFFFLYSIRNLVFYTKPGFQEIFKGVIVHENKY